MTTNEATRILGEVVQGTVVAVAVDPDGPLAGVLIRGPSGAGKSDLALRLIDACRWQRTRLVADDAVMICEQNGQLVARCPARIENLIEVRTVGIVPVVACPIVNLRLVLDFDQQCSRLPSAKPERIIAGSRIGLPVLPFDSVHLSAPMRVRHAVRAVLARHFGGARQDGFLSEERQGNS